MKFKSSLISSASGSIAGTTFYSGAGGIIARGRTVPTNPNSAAQQRARSDFGSAAAGWAVLSAAQQELWNDYAELTPIADKLGGMINISGQAMYMRWASARSLVGETIASAPAAGITGLGEPPATVAVDGDTDTATVTFGGTGASEDGNAYILTSSALSLGKNSVKQKFRFAGEVDVAQDDSSVNIVMSGHTFVKDERRVFQVRVCYDDGRLSQILTSLVTLTGI